MSGPGFTNTFIDNPYTCYDGVLIRTKAHITNYMVYTFFDVSNYVNSNEHRKRIEFFS